MTKTFEECKTEALKNMQGWQSIETAPIGNKIILGNFNPLKKWRSYMGWYVSQEEIEESWENCDCPEGWYEHAENSDDDINMFSANPTHWMPLPQPPKENK